MPNTNIGDLARTAGNKKSDLYVFEKFKEFCSPEDAKIVEEALENIHKDGRSLAERSEIDLKVLQNFYPEDSALHQFCAFYANSNLGYTEPKVPRSSSLSR
jgi:hypothetical protein